MLLAKVSMSFLHTMVAVFFCCLAAGCGGVSDRPDMGMVTGTVLQGGKPITGATVLFIPETGRGSFGTTDASGIYTLQYTDTLAGARVGHHVVQISMNASPMDGGTQQDPIPLKYRENSILSADVKPGKNEFNFDLDVK